MKVYSWFKYFFDIFFVIIFSPLILLLLIFFSVLLLIFDGFPIFYVSERVGKNYRIFKMYKFRTMKSNSIDLRNPDGSTYNSYNDQRVTFIGNIYRKFSIDEIPQLLNVLKGEMSLVGPRPDLPDQVIIYDNLKLDKLRFLLKPGITGYAQLKARNSVSLRDRNLLDNHYYYNYSFILDIKILFLTIFKVLASKNINKNVS
jgi:lipopolysaccharide/colanic/teichoic acid biosynthesis glycosyltransferase